MPALVFGLEDPATVRAAAHRTWRSCCTTVSRGPTRHRSATSSFYDTTRTPANCAGTRGGAPRVFRQFTWLEVSSVKAVLSRPAQPPVTRAVGQLLDDL